MSAAVKEPGLRRTVAVNSISNWINLGVTTLLQLLLVPLMLSRMGVEAYGVWALLAFGLAYPVILERAYGNAVVHFTAACRTRPEERNRYVSAAILVMAATVAATLLAAAVVAPRISSYFPAIPSTMEAAVRRTTLLVGATLALNMILAPFGAVLRGEQKFVAYNAVVIGSNVLRACGLVLILMRSPTIVAVQTIYVLAAFLGCLAMIAVAHRSVAGFRWGLAGVTRAHMSEIWRFSSHALARSGGRAVMLSTLALLVGRFGAASDVALYDVASKIPQFLNALMLGAQSVLQPVVSGLAAEGKQERIRAVVRNSTTIHFAIIAAAALLILFDAEPLLRLWLGEAAVPQTTQLVRLLTVSVIPGGAFGLWLPVLVGVGRLRALTISSLAGAISAILGAALLMSRGMSPAFAPAWSMIVVFWIYRGVWLPAYGTRALGEPLAVYLKSLMAPLAAAAVALGLMALRASVVPGGHPLTSLALDGVLLSAVLGVFALRGVVAGRRGDRIGV